MIIIIVNIEKFDYNNASQCMPFVTKKINDYRKAIIWWLLFFVYQFLKSFVFLALITKFVVYKNVKISLVQGMSDVFFIFFFHHHLIEQSKTRIKIINLNRDNKLSRGKNKFIKVFTFGRLSIASNKIIIILILIT